MKKLYAIVLSIMLFAGAMPAAAEPSASSSGAPAIFFSDLTSGPNTGGKDNNGVFVTVAGRNFGASRGSGSVSVGGGDAADYPVWTDTRITFQLGAKAKSGDIIVNTSNGSSNGIRFTVRGGRIFFVDDSSPADPGSGSLEDPWRSPKSFFDAQQPGDTCYFRSGTYSGQYGSASRPYNVSFYNTGSPSGSADNEIAWVGYPNENALFKADGGPVYHGAFEFTGGQQYIIVAGLSIYGKGDGREQVRLYSDNLKLVNCKVDGIKTLSYAMVGVTASNLKIWGNELFGAKSRNKLDHIVYFQSGGRISNVDVGWNYIHDNDIAVGPVFSWNIPGQSADNIMIHDNKIDCRKSSDGLRLAGIWNGAGGSITFSNNIVIGAGAMLNNDDSYNVIYASFGKIQVYNNTFYQSHGAGSNFVVNLFGGASGEVKNNIFYNEKNMSYVKGNAAVDSNLYYGGSGNVPSGDAHAVTEDPHFANPSALDFHIAPGTPACSKGADLSRVVKKDFDGVLRKRTPGIGAFESGAGGASAGFLAGEGGSLTIPGTNYTLAPGEVKIVGSAARQGTVNPGKGDEVQIYFLGSAVGNFECRVFTLTGDLVWDSAMDNVQGGVFDWSPNSVASGIYLANIKGPGIRGTKKIAVLQ